jgi:hypothetical protein
VEAVPGTYEEPTVVVPLEKGGDLWVPDFDKETFDPESGSHGSKETVVITDFASQSVSAKMKLPSAHGLIAPLLAACGVAATPITGGQSYAYSTVSKATASLMQVGQRVTTRAYGERGDLTLTAEVGKPVEIGFEFKGMFKEQVRLAATDPDNSIPATPSMDMVFLPKSCTAHLINGNQAHFKKIELKLGADIGTAKDTCPGESWTKDVKPELMITMMDDIDNAQSFDDVKNGTQFNLSIELHDINGVKKYELIVPKMVVIDHKTPKSEGLISLERTFECRKVTGDDNWELKAFD